MIWKMLLVTIFATIGVVVHAQDFPVVGGSGAGSEVEQSIVACQIRLFGCDALSSQERCLSGDDNLNCTFINGFCSNASETNGQGCLGFSNGLECSADPFCIWDVSGADFCRERSCLDLTAAENCTGACAWDDDLNQCVFSVIEPTFEPPTCDAAMMEACTAPCVWDVNDRGGSGGIAFCRPTLCEDFVGASNCTMDSTCFYDTNTSTCNELLLCEEAMTPDEDGFSDNVCAPLNQAQCNTTPVCSWGQNEGGVGSGISSGINPSRSALCERNFPTATMVCSPANQISSCYAFTDQEGCDANDVCMWETIDGSGITPGSGYTGYCSEVNCDTLPNQTACEAFGATACVYLNGACSRNPITFVPDRSPCFVLTTQALCDSANFNCSWDTVSSRGHCRGPCHTQFASGSCSPGCVSDTVVTSQDDRCISVDDAECSSLNDETACMTQSARCDYRPTSFFCPFSNCIPGSPCARMHVCNTDGFQTAQCCQAMTSFCENSGDAACWTSAREIQERFNCSIIEVLPTDPTPDVSIPVGQECFSIISENECNTTSGCVYRAFLGSGQGSGGSVGGYCSAAICNDFSGFNQLNCLNQNCSFNVSTGECYEPFPIFPTDPVVLCGSGAIGSGSSGCLPTDNVIDAGCEALGETECRAESTCYYIPSVPGSGGSGILVEDYCAPLSCYVFSNQSQCTSNNGLNCSWDFGSCSENNFGPMACAYTDMVLCEADAGCDVVSTGEQQYCIEKSCLTQSSQVACESSVHGFNCVWSDDSCFEDIGTGTSSGDGTGVIGGGSACNNLQFSSEAECQQNNCTWYASGTEGFCSTLECEFFTVEANCVSSGCSWETLLPSSGGDFGLGSGLGSGQDQQMAGYCHSSDSIDDDEDLLPCYSSLTPQACDAENAGCFWVMESGSGGYCEAPACDPACVSMGVNCSSCTCELITSRASCNNLPFCTFMEGGPGCKQYESDCGVFANCEEYTQFSSCTGAGCYFSVEFGCTTEEPTLPPVPTCADGTFFLPTFMFTPEVFFGPDSPISCLAAWTTGTRFQDASTVRRIVESECCGIPFVPPTMSPTSPTMSPTTPPTVEGGSTMGFRLRSDTTGRFENLMALTDENKDRLTVLLTAAAGREVSGLQGNVLRISLNRGGRVNITFARATRDEDVNAFAEALEESGLTETVDGVTYRYASGTVFTSTEQSARPTPAPTTPGPTTNAPTTPNPTTFIAPPPPTSKRPTAAPTVPGPGVINTSANADGSDDSVETNLMIIIIVCCVVAAALIGFLVYVRTKRNAPAPVQTAVPQHYQNPIYAKSAHAPGPGVGPTTAAEKSKGLVRVESMC